VAAANSSGAEGADDNSSEEVKEQVKKGKRDKKEKKILDEIPELDSLMQGLKDDQAKAQRNRKGKGGCKFIPEKEVPSSMEPPKSRMILQQAIPESNESSLDTRP